MTRIHRITRSPRLLRAVLALGGLVSLLLASGAENKWF
jgi:hypothetical protein